MPVFFQSLSMLLNGTPFAFVIDLAALASRREYLKLDKWLTDKIREHGVSLNLNQLPLLKIDSLFIIIIIIIPVARARQSLAFLKRRSRLV